MPWSLTTRRGCRRLMNLTGWTARFTPVLCCSCWFSFINITSKRHQTSNPASVSCSLCSGEDGIGSITTPNIVNCYFSPSITCPVFPELCNELSFWRAARRLFGSVVKWVLTVGLTLQINKISLCHCQQLTAQWRFCPRLTLSVLISENILFPTVNRTENWRWNWVTGDLCVCCWWSISIFYFLRALLCCNELNCNTCLCSSLSRSTEETERAKKGTFLLRVVIHRVGAHSSAHYVSH